MCRYAETSSLYNNWLNELPLKYEVIEGCPADWQPPEDAGIVIAHEHYRWEESHTLRRIYEQRQVPVLILADGVMEFRNTWQNPTIPDASIFQPLLAHKIACVGHASARLIESWGNFGKTEIVGLPRLDGLLAKEILPINREGMFRLLITTATTPAFTTEQRDTVVQSLTDLKQELEDMQEINGRPARVAWRLTDGFASALEIDLADDAETTLVEAIESSDAVITTPSTIYLESALLNRPTAVLDYSNSPQFVPSAWTISARQHMRSILNELTDPPPSKMLFQD